MKNIQQELTRISKDKVVDKTKYLALFMTAFYEKLFQKIDNKKLLVKIYNRKLKELPKGEQKDALTFFYRIRRDELDKKFKWEMKELELRKLIREEIQKLNEDKLKELQHVNATKFIKDLDVANKRLCKLMKEKGL